MSKTIINFFGSECLSLLFGPRHHRHRHQAVALLLSIRNLPGQTIQLIGENKLIMLNTQTVILTANPLDANGAPAVVVGVPVWSGGDATLFTAVPSADGLSVAVTAVDGAVGTASVTVTAVNAEGTSVASLPFDVAVTTGAVPGLMTQITITAGVPTQK